MRSETLCAMGCLMAAFAASAFAQQNDSCSALMNVKVPSLEITKATHVEAGSTEAIPWNQSRSAPLPAYCRIEGVINRRTGVDGEEFGIASYWQCLTNGKPAAFSYFSGCSTGAAKG
jgi:hypothetical protein